MTNAKPYHPLWPYITLQLLSLGIWAPIAALAGMGYSPNFSWTNVFLAIFHLYPVFMLIAFPLALALRNSGKIGLAVLAVLSPALLSVGGILLLAALAKTFGW